MSPTRVGLRAYGPPASPCAPMARPRRLARVWIDGPPDKRPAGWLGWAREHDDAGARAASRERSGRSDDLADALRHVPRVPDDAARLHRRHAVPAGKPGLRGRPRARHGAAPCVETEAPAVPRGRGRRRQDGDRKGFVGGARPGSHPPAMLRGAGRLHRRLRVEFRRPDGGNPRQRGGRRHGPRGIVEVRLRRPLSHQAARPAGAPALARRPAGVSDRRA